MKHLIHGAVIAALLVTAPAVTGHNLIAESSLPNSWSDPVPIRDAQVSQVYYCKLEDGRRRLWFRFSGRQGDHVWFQAGVPVIDRLRGLRPKVAVVGPGLSPSDIGIELPPGLGAVVFESTGEPREFHEEFTGTSSWIVIEQEYVLPSAGTWYVVAFSETPESGNDKMWLAIGTKERFGLGDLLRFGAIKRFVRDFHEVK
jgi:hypothetical protein